MGTYIILLDSSSPRRTTTGSSTSTRLLATYLANLLITRTAVLVGYSLDDPDFRQLWQVIGERLGKARGWPTRSWLTRRERISPGLPDAESRSISLPGSRAKYSHVLATAFDELREYMQTHLSVQAM